MLESQANAISVRCYFLPAVDVSCIGQLSVSFVEKSRQTRSVAARGAEKLTQQIIQDDGRQS